MESTHKNENLSDESVKSPDQANCFIFSQFLFWVCQDHLWPLFLHIQGPVLPYPGSSTFTSGDQYFHIREPVLSHPGTSFFTSGTRI